MGGRKGLGGHSIDKDGEEGWGSDCMIQATQRLSKPKASRRELMYFQLILSKYLERSSLMSIPRVLIDFSEWMTSCARMTLSMIFLPSTYLSFSLEMMYGKIRFESQGDDFHDDFVDYIAECYWSKIA
jgi:hypothetical protein